MRRPRSQLQPQLQMGEAPRSHQPRGFHYGKRIPGYYHPPNHNGQVRIWFRGDGQIVELKPDAACCCGALPSAHRERSVDLPAWPYGHLRIRIENRSARSGYRCRRRRSTRSTTTSVIGRISTVGDIFVNTTIEDARSSRLQHRRLRTPARLSLDPLRWGLIPYFCADPKGGRKPINAKCETVRTLPSFRDAYRRRR